MALVDFYPSMQPSAVEVQNGKFFTLPIRPTKITQILSVLTHFTRWLTGNSTILRCHIQHIVVRRYVYLQWE